MLTCKPCNNNHGSKLDAAVLKHQNMVSSFKGKSPLSGRIVSDNFNVAVDVTKTDDGIVEFWPCQKRSDPDSLKHLFENGLGEKGETFNLKLKYQFTHNQHESGLLRCAYLALFRLFGYGYLSFPSVEKIRGKICDWDSTHLDFANQIMGTDNEHGRNVDPYLVGMNQKSKPHFLSLIHI